MASVFNHVTPYGSSTSLYQVMGYGQKLPTTTLSSSSSPFLNSFTSTHQFESYCITHSNDSSHQSAGALDRLIKKDFAEKRLVFVVAMASDKDHLDFAKELLSGLKPDLVVSVEADIGGGKVRSTACSVE